MYRVVVAVSVAALLVSMLPPLPVAAAGETISGGSNKTGLTDEQISLTGLTVSGNPGDTVPVSLSVDRGILSMTTTTGLTFDGDSTGSILNFEGTVSDVNAALATLRYRTIYAETVTLTAQLTQPGEVFFPDNGHVYEVVNSGAISANDARTAAAALTKYGSNGYLATITTQSENDYVGPRLGGDGWFGASDDTTEGDWKWVTGPEAGTSFWSGLSANDGGGPVAGRYSNWANGEPNDVGGENCAQFYSNGSGWNDLDCDDDTLGYYIVEYGAPGDLPTVSSDSFTITTTFPTAANVPIANCLDLIDVGNTNQSDNRYNNLSLTADIDCTGQSLDPMFNEVDPDFGPLGYRGTFNGQGHTISGFELSEALTDNVGLFATTRNATIQNLTLSGDTVAGQDCVGAVAGTATDTVFENIDSSLTVTGEDSVGGLVGCLNAEAADSVVLDSSSSGDITSSSSILGGIVGDIFADNEFEALIEGNTFTGELINTGGSRAGGIVGGARATNASIAFHGNEATGTSLTATYEVGGMIGAVDLEDGANMAIEENTLIGNVSGLGEVGGLVGEVELANSELLILETEIDDDITGIEDRVGGFVGSAWLEGDETTTFTITGSSMSGDVSGAGELGGLVGTANRDNSEEQFVVTASTVTGSVTGTNDDAGGIVGFARGAYVHSSYATGAVSGDDGVGGLIGRNSGGTIVESFATGNVSGDDRIGGLAGANGGLITNSYARGTVTGDVQIGGLVGRCGGSVEFSYATGAVSGNLDVGGLVGNNDDDCDTNSSFWDDTTTGQTTSATGTAKTTTEMKAKATFTNTDTSEGLLEAWDFDSTWGITLSVNNGYPCLTWQHTDCVGDDEDEDGIPTVVENAAPNSGDANNDGTLDSAQSNVASFVNGISGKHTTVALPDACLLITATVESESTQDAQDAGFDYQSGLVGFTADCGTPGFSADVNIYQYGAAADGLVLRKHNRDTNAYFTINSATISQQTIGGQAVAVASYTVVDGGELDMDGGTEGFIDDPVGLALGVVGAPNTGLGGVLRQSLYSSLAP